MGNILKILGDMGLHALGGFEKGFAGTNNVNRAIAQEDAWDRERQWREEEREYQDKKRQEGYARQDKRYGIVDERYNKDIEHRNKREGIVDSRYNANITHRDKRENVLDSRYNAGITHRDKREGISDKRYDQEWALKTAPWDPKTDPNIQRTEYLQKNYNPVKDPQVRKEQYMAKQNPAVDIKDAFKSLKDSSGKFFFDDMVDFNETNSDANYAAVPIGSPGGKREWYTPKAMEKGTYILKKKDKFGFAKGQVKKVGGKYYKYNGGDKWDEL